MKKILFVMSQFNMGGIEKELLCLFDSLDKSKYIIELCLTGGGGQLESELPDFVKVFYLQSNTVQNLINLVKGGHFFTACKKIYYYLRRKMSKNSTRDYWGAKTGAIPGGEYDCVIAYDGLDSVVISIAEEIKAKCRVLWEHGPLIGIDKEFVKHSKKAARSFDKIVCVSEALKREFAERYDLPIDCFCVIYNLVNVSEILEKSKAAITDMPQTEGKVLVTVGRLHPQKGVEKIPQIARLLADAGCEYTWYLVGDGVLREEVEDLCHKFDVTDRVILLGSKNNPYPYIKNCDIYVQTSSWEGWCLTVQEARIFCKPMVVTPLPVLREQIDNGRNGLISADMSPEAIFESIKTLIVSSEMQERFVQELDKENHENICEVQKLYDIIES